jgi:uncharacterized membrane protein HdeD (DUF308 family)
MVFGFSELKQEAIKAPKYVRIIDIVLGAISLILAGLVMGVPGFAGSLIVVFLSIALLVAGLEGIIVGASGRGLSGGQRVLRLIVGVIAVGLSMAVIVFPLSALISATVLLSIAFLFLGAGAIAKGITERYMTGWARAMYVIVGGIVLALSIPVMLFPLLGLVTLYTILSTVLIVNGTGYVIAGVTGVVYAPLGEAFIRRGKAWESDAA